MRYNPTTRTWTQPVKVNVTDFEGPNTLLMLSGGIDSAYVLYHFLKDTDQDIHVHHVNLLNKEGRAKYEKEATVKVMNYMADNGWLPRITYTESTYSYGTVPKIVRDHNVWAFQTGLLFATYPSLQNLVLPQHSDSYTAGDTKAQFRVTRGKYETMVKTIAHRTINIYYPIGNITKAEVILRTPQELLELAWYCRKPTSDGTPCKKCLTCKQVAQGMKLREHLLEENDAAIRSTYNATRVDRG